MNNYNRKRKESQRVKKIVSLIVAVLFVLLGFYVGGWLLFISPIMETAKAFDGGYLTATIVALTIIKCIFASFIGFLIISVGIIISKKIGN